MRTWRHVHLFFFQAEDGIRDLTVTGVQTCALPIWELQPWITSARTSLPTPLSPVSKMRVSEPAISEASRNTACISGQIGRASCRGKSVDLGGRRIIKKKKKTESEEQL